MILNESTESADINLQLFRGLSSNRSLLSAISNSINVNLNNKDDGSGRQQWKIVKIPNDENRLLFNFIVIGGVQSNHKYLSTTTDGSIVNLWTGDDRSGRQRWEFIPIENPPTLLTFKIKVGGGVSSEQKYLGATSDGSKILLFKEDDGSGLQRWQAMEAWQA